MGHLSHGYVSHNQRVDDVLLWIGLPKISKNFGTPFGESCEAAKLLADGAGVALIHKHDQKSMGKPPFPIGSMYTIYGTLWWTNSLQLKMAIYSGFSHKKWWFSIAMLVHVSSPEGNIYDILPSIYPKC